jgi:phosphocarrier protein HPr
VAVESTVTICNRRGLHARASARFVTVASQFEAEIMVSRDGEAVLGTSIMGLMMLAAGIGDTITISANGPAEDTALAAMVALVEERFGED